MTVSYVMSENCKVCGDLDNCLGIIGDIIFVIGSWAISFTLSD